MICISTKTSFFLSFIVFFLANIPLTAQQNGDMEDWSTSGSPPPFDWKFPTGWTSTNATSEFVGAAITRSTDKHSGTYAAQLRTLDLFGTITRSQLALGNVKLDFPNYRLVGYTGGEALNLYPDRVSFYYKLTAGNANEYAVADLLIKRADAGSSIPDTVYYESVHLEPASSYTEVNIPIPVDNINPATDSIVIVFSSNDTSETGLNILLIDDVSIDFTSAVEPITQSTIEVYPNPAHTNSELSFTSKEINKISVFDPAGNVLFAKIEPGLQSIDLTESKLAPGIYFLRMNDEKLVKLVVLE